MRNILLVIFIGFTGIVYSQPGISKVIEQNGVEFYQHKVESGNTLWGIHTMYSVPVERLVQDNPEISNGLKVGQIVLVYKGASSLPDKVVTSSYKVKNKETLYGLSKKFNTTVDELIRLNPELAQGLQKGQIIQVPGDFEPDVQELPDNVEPVSVNPFVVDTVETNGVVEEVQMSFSDSTIRHVVLAHETMYSISKRFMVSISELMKMNGLTSTSVKEGQVLIVPVKNERVEKVEIKSILDTYNPDSNDSLVFDKKESYKIVILLPFYLEYGKGYSEYISNLATQFYMGTVLAIEELERLGLKADVHVYDTKNDSAVVSKLLLKKELLESDLIIGPLLAKNMSLVSDFCKMNKIRMISPVATDSDILRNNRLVYASVASEITLMDKMAKYMLKHNAKDNIVLIKPLDEHGKVLYEAFRKSFNESEFSGTRPKLTESTVDGFNIYIRRGVNSRFVVPTNDRKTVTKFMNNLNRSAFRSKADDLFVYGTKEWVNHADINDVYKNKYNFHYANSNYLDYYTDEMIELNKEFRNRYKTDMSKIAVQAYDVVLHFCSTFFLDEVNAKLMMNNFEMTQLSKSDGYENSNVFIIRQEDFQLSNIDATNPE